MRPLSHTAETPLAVVSYGGQSSCKRLRAPTSFTLNVESNLSLNCSPSHRLHACIDAAGRRCSQNAVKRRGLDGYLFPRALASLRRCAPHWETHEAHGWVWVHGEACRALAGTPTCTVYTSASPSSAFFVVALQAQGLYDAVTHLQPCEVPRSMLSLRYCALSHSARSHRAPLHHSIARPRHTPTRTTQLVAAYPRT